MSNNTNFKKYPAYKDSGIEWIGEIPVDWGVRKLKHYFTFEKGKNAQVYTNEYVGANPGDYPVFSGQTEDEGVMGRIASFDYDTGEVLLATTVGAKAMTTRMISGKFSLSQNCALFIPRKGINVRYYQYFVDRLFNFEKGMISLIMQPSLRFEDLIKYRILMPSCEVQDKVADYLDHKAAQIDDLITKKERMIELLNEERTAIINQAVTKGLNPKAEMKPACAEASAGRDSGIDWLGRIPNGWKIKKLKYLSRKIGSGVTPKGGALVYLTEGIPILRSQNIHFDGLKLDDVAYISEDMHREMITTKVLTGDVLLNITGASIGRCNYWPEKFGEANVNQHVCIVRPNSLIDTKYLYFLLSSEIGQRQIEDSQKGISREGLNFEELGKFVILFPEYDKQVQIIDYIDKAIHRINSLMNKAIQQIEYLKEYRTSLISEAVTGKIDVSTALNTGVRG